MVIPGNLENENFIRSDLPWLHITFIQNYKEKIPVIINETLTRDTIVHSSIYVHVYLYFTACFFVVNN